MSTTLLNIIATAAGAALLAMQYSTLFLTLKNHYQMADMKNKLDELAEETGAALSNISGDYSRLISKIDDLERQIRDNINVGSMSAEEEQDILQKFSALRDQAKALAGIVEEPAPADNGGTNPADNGGTAPAENSETPAHP